MEGGSQVFFFEGEGVRGREVQGVSGCSFFWVERERGRGGGVEEEDGGSWGGEEVFFFKKKEVCGVFEKVGGWEGFRREREGGRWEVGKVLFFGGNVEFERREREIRGRRGGWEVGRREVGSFFFFGEGRGRELGGLGGRRVGEGGEVQRGVRWALTCSGHLLLKPSHT